MGSKLAKRFHVSQPHPAQNTNTTQSVNTNADTSASNRDAYLFSALMSDDKNTPHVGRYMERRFFQNSIDRSTKPASAQNDPEKDLNKAGEYINKYINMFTNALQMNMKNTTNPPTGGIHLAVIKNNIAKKNHQKFEDPELSYIKRNLNPKKPSPEVERIKRNISKNKKQPNLEVEKIKMRINKKFRQQVIAQHNQNKAANATAAPKANQRAHGSQRVINALKKRKQVKEQKLEARRNATEKVVVHAVNDTRKVDAKEENAVKTVVNKTETVESRLRSAIANSPIGKAINKVTNRVRNETERVVAGERNAVNRVRNETEAVESRLRSAIANSPIGKAIRNQTERVVSGARSAVNRVRNETERVGAKVRNAVNKVTNQLRNVTEEALNDEKE